MVEPNALRDLWLSHASRLVLIARSIGEPAEDAVQEAFVALAKEKQLPRDPLAWLVRVTRNQLLHWRRGGQRRRERERIVARHRWFEPSAESVENRLDAADAMQAMESLPAEQREIVVMHLWGEMSFETIAGVIGTSRATAHRRYIDGLRQLQERLEPRSRAASGDTVQAPHRDFT